MKYTPIASLTIPAIASTTGWVRCAKRVTISKHTTPWMIKVLEAYSK